MTPSGIHPATLRLVPLCLNQKRLRVRLKFCCTEEHFQGRALLATYGWNEFRKLQFI